MKAWWRSSSRARPCWSSRLSTTRQRPSCRRRRSCWSVHNPPSTVHGSLPSCWASVGRWTVHCGLPCIIPRSHQGRGARMQEAEIGIIGGSGLYQMPGLTNLTEKQVVTPFGKPSDAYHVGTLEGRRVAFLARHGRGHRILPTELNFRANIHGFRQLGVERIVSISAVGSLKEEHKPLDFVIPDQFFDRT